MNKFLLAFGLCLLSFSVSAQDYRDPAENMTASQVPEVASPDPEKWETIKDLNNKTRSIGGEAPLYATDDMTLRAGAQYVFPNEQKTTHPDAYGLSVSVTFAL